jgi:large subunit ribosomal protein L4
MPIKEKKVAKTVTKTIKKETKKIEKGLKASVFNKEGEATKSVFLPKEIFGQKANKALLAQVIRVYLANKKPATASTKTRAEVAGGGRKPYRQKGTGRARAGSIRAAGRRGGGIVFGPRSERAELKVPKKMRQKAFSIALSDRFTEGNLFFADNLEFKEPRTKSALKFINKLPLKQKDKTLLVLGAESANTVKSFRNLENIEIKKIQDLNMLDLLKSKNSIFTLPALEKLKERFDYGNK